MSDFYRSVAIATSVFFSLNVILALIGWRIHRRRERALETARENFRDRIRTLGVAFRDAADRTGYPRGLRWVGCDLSGDWEIVRDRRAGSLVALAGATLHFEAIEGGDMEDVPAVSLPRSATVVFVWDRGEWIPTGRAIMNHDPAESRARFEAEFDAV